MDKIYNWTEFRSMDLKQIYSLIRNKGLINISPGYILKGDYIFAPKGIELSESKKHAVWTFENKEFTEYASVCGDSISGSLITNLDRVTCDECKEIMTNRGFIKNDSE